MGAVKKTKRLPNSFIFPTVVVRLGGGRYLRVSRPCCSTERHQCLPQGEQRQRPESLETCSKVEALGHEHTFVDTF